MSTNRSNTGSLIAGAALIVFGLLALAGQLFERVQFLGSDLAVFHHRRRRIVLCRNVHWWEIGCGAGNPRLHPHFRWVDAIPAKPDRSLGKLVLWLDGDPDGSGCGNLHYGPLY